MIYIDAPTKMNLQRGICNYISTMTHLSITITMTTLYLLSSALLHFFRAKSSSSRFTTSDKYENLFQVRTTSLQINEMLDIYEPTKTKITIDKNNHGK